MVEFPEVLLQAAKRDSKISGARFWALIVVAVFSIAYSSGAYVFPLVSADRDKKLEELNQQVRQLTSALARTNANLAEVKSSRQKAVELYEAQLEDDRQRLGKLEAQALEITVLRTEIPLLKAKIASMKKEADRLTGDFLKSILAAGATTSTPSYASGPNRLKLPPELEKLSPDLAEEKRKPRCLMTLKGFDLFCDSNSPGSQQ